MELVLETLWYTILGLGLLFGIPGVLAWAFFEWRDRVNAHKSMVRVAMELSDEVVRLKVQLHEARMDMKVMERWLTEMEAR